MSSNHQNDFPLTDAVASDSRNAIKRHHGFLSKERESLEIMHQKTKATSSQMGQAIHRRKKFLEYAEEHLNEEARTAANLTIKDMQEVLNGIEGTQSNLLSKIKEIDFTIEELFVLLMRIDQQEYREGLIRLRKDASEMEIDVEDSSDKPSEIKAATRKIQELNYALDALEGLTGETKKQQE